MLSDLIDILPDEVKDLFRELLFADEVAQIPSRINYSLVFSVILFSISAFVGLVCVKYLLEVIPFVRFYKEDYKDVVKDKTTKMLMWLVIFMIIQSISLCVFFLSVFQ